MKNKRYRKKNLKSLQKKSQQTFNIAKILNYLFIVLFFITPFLVSIRSYELFEFPKMLFVYFIAILVFSFWTLDMVLNKKFIFKHSIFDLPFIAIFITQLISTLLSIHPHTSWWGYYSRFHGGMWSTIAYLVLAWAFITYAHKRWLKDIFYASLASASIVALYGVAEHFGIDAKFWVQDVQNRIFSSLGQPNWLAAWMGAILPLTLIQFMFQDLFKKDDWPIVAILFNGINLIIAYLLTFLISKQALPLGGYLWLMLFFLGILDGISIFYLKKFADNKWLQKTSYFILSLLFIVTLLYTKSRSGVLAMFISIGFLLIFSAFKLKTKLQKWLYFAVIFGLSLTVLLIGTEWTPKLDNLANYRQTLQKSFGNKPTSKLKHPDHLISKSTDIRRVVWQGATKIWQRYPLFGSGTATFAYSYYLDRPREHNDLSEWDFLYNKAHNEYLNFLANNGIIGLTAIFYLFTTIIWALIKKEWKKYAISSAVITIITGVIFLIKKSLFVHLIDKLLIYPPLLQPLGIALGLAIFIQLTLGYFYQKKFNLKELKINSSVRISLLAVTISIFITNFYGFSVVNIALILFFIPAWIVVNGDKDQDIMVNPQFYNLNSWQWLGLSTISIVMLFGILKITNIYRADLNYNRSRSYFSQNKILQADETINKALTQNPKEASFSYQKAAITANAAILLNQQKNSTKSALLGKEYAEKADNWAQNTLALNPLHLNLYKQVASIYLILAQIDPQYRQKAIETLKASTKLAPTEPQAFLNLGIIDLNRNQPESAIDYLQKAVTLKPNYTRGWTMLGLAYQRLGKTDQAKKAYQFILNNIDPKNAKAIAQLKKLNKE